VLSEAVLPQKKVFPKNSLRVFLSFGALPAGYKLLRQIDTHMRCEHKPVPAIITKINVARLKKGIETVEKSTVYRYVNGETHRRQNVENRGRD
jgi:hypothetical protein